MKLRKTVGIMLTLCVASMLTLTFNIQPARAMEPLWPFVKVTVDKPYPQTYRYGETMHIKFLLINPMSQPKEILVTWYSFWLYNSLPLLTPVGSNAYTIPAETVFIYDYKVPLAWSFPVTALWIVVIQDVSTMNTISVNYLLWSYTP
jgi:hypothetical protein